MNSFICFFAALFLCCPVFSNPDKSHQDELIHLIKHDCGSCHGMSLKGGLGPSLTPDNLHEKNIEYLFQVISNGVPNTPMPPWKTILSEDDIKWISKQLQMGIQK